MSKKDRLLKIIEEIQDMYPHLDRIMVTDLDNPDSIIITSQENLEMVASVTGLDLDDVDSFFVEEDGDLEELSMFDFFVDDDDDKGTLQ